MTDIFLSFFRISISTSLIVIILMLLAPFLNKRYASKWKYWVWIFLAVRLVIPFSAMDGKFFGDLFLQREMQAALKSEKNGIDHSSEQAAVPRQMMVEIPAQMTTPISMQFSESNINITLLDIVVFIWMLGSLVFVSVHLFSYLHYKDQVIKKGTIIKDCCILSQIFEIKRELHIRCTVYAVEYPEAFSPMITGFFKPVLILPEEKYRSEELFFILKHELVHLKRKDVYMKLLFVAANALHWFNPLIWMMQKEAVIDMELSCDERVTKGADYAVRKAYTETLLSTLQKQCKKRVVLSTEFYGGVQIMKKRFKNILYKTGNKNGVVLLIGAVILTVSLGTLVGCSVAKENRNEISGQSENKVILMGGQEKDVYEKPEHISFDDDQPAVVKTQKSGDEHDMADTIRELPVRPTTMEIPQNGQIYGYISNFDGSSAAIDRQIWVTSESEEWKPGYNEDAGFEVVDAKGEDITYPFCEDCTYSVLENHHAPIAELDKKEFENYLSEMEYPVLWVIELKDGQIKNIMEQYIP